MTARKLVVSVTVRDENNDPHTFGPDSKEVPAWARKAIDNPKAWGKDVDSDDEPDVYDENSKVAELEALIAKRNEGRADDGLIVPEGKTKADLFAALQKDDAATA